MIKRKKKSKYLSTIPPHFFEGCRQISEVKKDQGSIQAHRSVGVLSMNTFLKKLVEKKTKFLQKVVTFCKASQKNVKKADPIDFHGT